jgi:hypothetical protein
MILKDQCHEIFCSRFFSFTKSSHSKVYASIVIEIVSSQIFRSNIENILANSKQNSINFGPSIRGLGRTAASKKPIVTLSL